MNGTSSSNRIGAFSRAREVLRHESFGNLLLRITAAIGYRIGIWCAGWYERPLTLRQEPGDIGLPLEFIELGPGDADQYVAFQRHTSAAAFRKRLNEGQHCYAARLNGRLVSSIFFATNSVWLDFLGRALDLEPDQVYFFEAHTAPEFRGRRLLPWVTTWANIDVYRQGYRRAVAVVAPENRSSIIMNLRFGYRRTGMLFYINIGPLKKELFWRSRS